MAIQTNKIMNLADGKLLYDDLRQRIEQGGGGNASIDDTAGAGDTDKVWSADKVVRELHVTPIFTPSTSNPSTYVCNMTFQKVYEAVSDGKCDGCIVEVFSGTAIALALGNASPNGVVFSTTYIIEGSTLTVNIGYESNGSVTATNNVLSILPLFAPGYNRNIFPVKAGDYCVTSDGGFYKANTDISVYESFNSSKWDAVIVSEELALNASNSNAMIANVEEDNTADVAYAIGETFVYDNKFYKATAAIAVNDVIVPGTNCTETSVSGTFVKFTDYATRSVGGVVKVNDQGLRMSNGVICLDGASTTQVKAESASNYAITPAHQHEAVYYGLSKIAGVDLKNETVTVGTYPTNAQTAIQNMIGVNPVEVVRLA